MSLSIQDACILLADIGLRIAEESAAWQPIDRNRDNWQIFESDRERFLWDMGVSAGYLMLHLALMGALDEWPRIKTMVLQFRATLKRAAVPGAFPFRYHLHLAPTVTLDGEAFELFDRAACVWLGTEAFPRWRDRTLRAKVYRVFARQLAERIRQRVDKLSVQGGAG